MKFLKIDRENMPMVDKVLLKKNYQKEISDYQSQMMLHALGADNKTYKTYRGQRYYHAYRNFYDAGGDDIAEWEDLVEKGYAKKNSFYHVTVEGIRILEYLTQCRIWGAYSCVADCKNDVLVSIMEDDVYCGHGSRLPTSSSDLSWRLAIPRKLVLETLRKLSEDGLVAKGYYGEADDEGFVHCMHGWYLTNFARNKYAEKYEELQKVEIKRINDILRNESEET